MEKPERKQVGLLNHKKINNHIKTGTEKMEKTIGSKLKLNKRTRVRLTPTEMQQLKEYVEFDRAAFWNINENAGIRRQTVLKTLERGWIELDPAIRLRDFLRELKKAKI